VTRTAAGLAAALLAALPGCGPPPDDAPRGVILLVVDTLRADHLGAYGSARGPSPALDAIAAGGTLFETAIAPSSWSPPSHTTIVTGLLPEHHHVLEWGHAIAPEAATLASRLKERGYETALFSSHLSLARGVGRFGEGFDTAFVVDNDRDAEVLRRAAEWVRERTGPYFLQIVLMTPHAPYTKYPSRLDDLYPEAPPDAGDAFPFVENRFVGDGGIPASVAMNGRHDAGYYVNRYDRSIRHVDRLIAAFLARIDGENDPSTLLVVTSDHGEAFGEHGSFAHELDLYDDLVRVPLIFRRPGRIPAGQVIDEPVGLVDLVPTILSLAGAPPPAATDGVDLSATLAGGDDGVPASRAFLGSYVTASYRRFMVRRDGYKLLRDANADGWELYDLVADPGERRDLLQEPAASAGARGAFESLGETMTEQLAAYATAIPALRRIEIAPDVMEELRALGYVD